MLVERDVTSRSVAGRERAASAAPRSARRTRPATPRCSCASPAARASAAATRRSRTLIATTASVPAEPASRARNADTPKIAIMPSPLPLPSSPARVNVAAMPAPIVAKRDEREQPLPGARAAGSMHQPKAKRKRDLENIDAIVGYKSVPGGAQLPADDVKARTEDRERVHHARHLQRLEYSDGGHERGQSPRGPRTMIRTCDVPGQCWRPRERKPSHRHPRDEPQGIRHVGRRHEGRDDEDRDERDARQSRARPMYSTRRTATPIRSTPGRLRQRLRAS